MRCSCYACVCSHLSQCEAAGQQQIRPSPVHVELVQGTHIAPRRRELRSAPGGGVLLLVGNRHDNATTAITVNTSKSAGCLCSKTSNGFCQAALVQRIQQSRCYFSFCIASGSHRASAAHHTRAAAAANPPRVLSSGVVGYLLRRDRRAFCSPRHSMPSSVDVFRTTRKYAEKSRRHTFRLDLRQICKQIALCECFPCHLSGMFGHRICCQSWVTDFSTVMLNFNCSILSCSSPVSGARHGVSCSCMIGFDVNRRRFQQS